MFSFGLISKEKWVFFVTFFKKKNDKNLPDHTHQSYYQSLCLSLATFTGRSPTLIPVPFLLTNIKQQKLLQNKTHMKSIQKKKLFEKKMFSFGLKSKEKWVFFCHILLSSRQKNDKNLPDHTHQSYYQSLSLSCNLCCQLFPPNNDFQRFFRGLN